MIHKIEAGKKYRLIDKKGFLSRAAPNQKYNKHLLKTGIFDSKGCVFINKVDGDGNGYCNETLVIAKHEYEYFELVPAGITPQTEVTITTTYGELARIYYVMGKVSGATRSTGSLWTLAGDLLGDDSRHKYHPNMPLHDHINYLGVKDWWEALFFKTEEQTKKELEIESKRAAIKQLEEEIKKLESA